ncbi:hypothetical protein [Salibacter halophilus]|uniref:Uncharacterized protein n=1 Tax=Salibacter halophilus TaxID=1803916 RepID=A0A6N6M573_9FLAO|nr:hypothetical protein [Salibacter halophilus]KAB1063494.1 hypothetical protein F3059_10530 [Salibacter halophilus]
MNRFILFLTAVFSLGMFVLLNETTSIKTDNNNTSIYNGQSQLSSVQLSSDSLGLSPSNIDGLKGSDQSSDKNQKPNQSDENGFWDYVKESLDKHKIDFPNFFELLPAIAI